jgi:hypothetical protein
MAVAGERRREFRTRSGAQLVRLAPCFGLSKPFPTSVTVPLRRPSPPTQVCPGDQQQILDGVTSTGEPPPDGTHRQSGAAHEDVINGHESGIAAQVGTAGQGGRSEPVRPRPGRTGEPIESKRGVQQCDFARSSLRPYSASASIFSTSRGEPEPIRLSSPAAGRVPAGARARP